MQESAHCPCCGAAEPDWDGRHATPEYWARDAEIERLRAVLTEARAWFLLPDNMDLNGSDRVYRIVDDALGTVYEQLEAEK